MSLTADVFPKLRTPKNMFNQLSKKSLSEHPSESNI